MARGKLSDTRRALRKIVEPLGAEEAPLEPAVFDAVPQVLGVGENEIRMRGDAVALRHRASPTVEAYGGSAVVLRKDSDVVNQYNQVVVVVGGRFDLVAQCFYFIENRIGREPM